MKGSAQQEVKFQTGEAESKIHTTSALFLNIKFKSRT